MPTPRPATALTALMLALTTAHVHAQGGPLTPPPGIPAPTMKSLDQVEPRIPLVAGSPGVTIDASGQITISQPGSYYLTGNLDINSSVYGIRIQASGVSLDLMGYAIRYTGAESALDAIEISASNVTIQNGHILSTTTNDGSSFITGGFDFGVWASNTYQTISVKNLSIQGVRGNGISIQGSSSLIENCQIRNAGSNGISGPQAIVRNCTVQTCGSFGISAHTVIDCRVNQSAAVGINAFIVANSSAVSTGNTGIAAVRTVSGSHGESTSTTTTSHGISASTGTVTGSTGISSGGHGISAGVVSASHGTSSGVGGVSSSGISATAIADSYGYAISTSGGHGISAIHTVSNSTGTSDETPSSRHGISAPNASVTNSRGIAAGGHGISGYTVNASRGVSNGANSTNSCGIFAYLVSDSSGLATATNGGHGISAAESVSGSHGESANTSNTLHGIICSFGNVHSSHGEAAGGSGIFASLVNLSRGASNGSTTSSHGISATTVTDSSGRANQAGGGHGISAVNVSGSNGYAVNGALNGIDATLVTHSFGSRQSTESGVFGIRATQANGCRADNNQSIGVRYNMP